METTKQDDEVSLESILDDLRRREGREVPKQEACRNGHPRTVENTYRYPEREGRKPRITCRICRDGAPLAPVDVEAKLEGLLDELGDLLVENMHLRKEAHSLVDLPDEGVAVWVERLRRYDAIHRTIKENDRRIKQIRKTAKRLGDK